MKKIILLITAFITINAFAQTADSSKVQIIPKIKWTHSAQTGLNITQSSFSDNWKGGV